MRAAEHGVLSDVERRMAEAVEGLARFNAAPELGGVTREVFSREYAAGISFVERSMRDVGLETRIDPFGNLIGRWDQLGGSAPVVLTGSHVDTTLNAGRFDGVVGVLGAVEAVRLLRQHGFQPHHPIEVVAFAGEEPRFGLGCIGSRAMVGQLSREDLDVLQDRSGTSLADALCEAGHDPDRLEEAVVPAPAIKAFVELHVEQGAVLESAGVPIGVVERIAAPHDLRVRMVGSAMHSGATPMGMRRDAMVGAAEAIVEIERIAATSPSGTTVGTVGVVRVRPGAVNVIPGVVEMEVDIRDSDEAARDRVVVQVLGALEEICSRRGLVLEHEEMVRDAPRACDPLVVAAVRAAVRVLDVESLPMISGAYHDAMVLAERFPVGMIFVPSAGGLSHSPEEYTSPTDMAHGVLVLAQTLRALTSEEGAE